MLRTVRIIPVMRTGMSIRFVIDVQVWVLVGTRVSGVSCVRFQWPVAQAVP